MLASAMVAVAACTLIATGMVLLESPAEGSIDRLAELFGVVAAALFLGSGALRISHWRITGEGRSLFMGTALVVLGGLALPLTSLAGVLMGDEEQSLLRALTALTATLATLALAVFALNAPAHETTARPERILLAASTAVIGVFVALVMVNALIPQLLVTTFVPPPMIRGALLSIAWFSVGLEAAMRAPERPWAGRVAPPMGCMAVAELMRVIGVVHPGAWEVTGAALVAVVAAFTTHSALLDLDEAARAERERLDAVSEALTTTQVGATLQNTWREDLIHDASNALAGLKAALLTLEKFGSQLDAATKDRLRAAALGEVGHLEHLIIRSERDDTVDFQLDPVLRTVVETRRAMGARIELGDCDLIAHGRPGDVATVLQNLLVNAERHAGGLVTVRTERSCDRIEIVVTDLGPGMPLTQVATLFQRGARGPSSPGSGLGLHVAHTLMQQQGGNLELRSHTGGCVFAIVLPAAGGPTDQPLPYQRRSRPPWALPTSVNAGGE